MPGICVIFVCIIPQVCRLNKESKRSAVTLHGHATAHCGACDCASLQCRHNERDGLSDYQPHDCLLSRLFRRRSEKTSKLRVTGLCAGNSPVTGEFPAQMASNAENVTIWWRHHAIAAYIATRAILSVIMEWHTCVTSWRYLQAFYLDFANTSRKQDPICVLMLLIRIWHCTLFIYVVCVYHRCICCITMMLTTTGEGVMSSRPLTMILGKSLPLRKVCASFERKFCHRYVLMFRLN